jgi:hypothetical protein
VLSIGAILIKPDFYLLFVEFEEEKENVESISIGHTVPHCESTLVHLVKVEREDTTESTTDY